MYNELKQIIKEIATFLEYYTYKIDDEIQKAIESRKIINALKDNELRSYLEALAINDKILASSIYQTLEYKLKDDNLNLIIQETEQVHEEMIKGYTPLINKLKAVQIKYKNPFVKRRINILIEKLSDSEEHTIKKLNSYQQLKSYSVNNKLSDDEPKE